jgi:polysaccharide pyruvyl transferase WcaK-like protein
VYDAIPAHRRNQVDLRGDYMRPDRYAELVAAHTAAISMRMHGAIIAAVSGTPVLMANASDKAQALASRTGGGMRGIESREDLARLDELVRPLLDDPRAALVRQNEAVEQMRTLARTNATLVAGSLR